MCFGFPIANNLEKSGFGGAVICQNVERIFAEMKPTLADFYFSGMGEGFSEFKLKVAALDVFIGAFVSVNRCLILAHTVILLVG